MSEPPPLADEELAALIERVFQPTADDHHLAIVVDLPDNAVPDTPAWQARRAIAASWARSLARQHGRLGLTISLYGYRNVQLPNADFPPSAWPLDHDDPNLLTHDADTLAATPDRTPTPFEEIFQRHSILLAPTQFSATAPLKLAAPRCGLRAATLPGFSTAMLPALRVDYEEVARRVERLKSLLDRSTGAVLRFVVAGQTHDLHLDLRHRTAHASSGLLRSPGSAGNLPSGEAYIVPYEGELHGMPSRSAGLLPVELEGEVVCYRIAANRAVEVLGVGPQAGREAATLDAEPAYGNIAELGLGVLADLGLTPTDTLLVDEKLGLHIAFGRSDHFGGQVGAADFSQPRAVVHIDRVYLPATQPQVRVAAVDLELADGSLLALMRDGAYVIDFGVDDGAADDGTADDDATGSAPVEGITTADA